MGLASEHVTGVILAGGRGTRMAGQDKGLLPYAGKLLIAQVIARLAPQLPRLAINANRHIASYARFGYPVFPDQDTRFLGPLAGVIAALSHSDTEWVLTVPTDTPALPADLVARMCAAVNNTHIHAVTCLGEWQPVFALWPRACLPALHDFLARGERAMHLFLREQQAVAVDFSDQPGAFANINTPAQLHAQDSISPVLGIVAWSGTGKTTLLKQLIPLLHQRGIRPGLIKHAHHAFDIDTPGKDSYELRQAGAEQVLVASRQRWALMTETPQQKTDPSLQELLTHLDHAMLDIVLVEGFKHERFPKIELHRPALQQPLLALDDPDIIAVATDVTALPETNCPLLDLNNPREIAGFIQQWILDQKRIPSA